MKKDRGIFEIIELSKYFNNDGISFDTDRSDGDFDSWGKTYPAEELPGSNERFISNGVMFVFPAKEDGKQNNIALSGENVKVPENTYDYLYVLGASEMGSFQDNLILEYEDHALDKGKLALSDFFCQSPLFDDKKAIECSHYHEPTGDVFWYESLFQKRERIQPAIWFQAMKCDSRKRLKNIQFPDNPSMHVFCLTLAFIDKTCQGDDSERRTNR